MRLLAEDYMTSDVQLFVILAAWKSDSCRVVKSSNPGQLASCQNVEQLLTWRQLAWIGGFKQDTQGACDNPTIVLTVPLFGILAAWKWEFSKVVWPSILKYLPSKNPLFGLLEAWQSDFSRVMRLLAEDYLASDEQHFVILAAWKSDSCRVVKSSNPGQLASCQPLVDILANWKCDSSKVYETLRSCFQWDKIKYNGDLKKTFLNGPDTIGTRLRGWLWAHNRNFCYLKTLLIARRGTLA
jgi:hypothetical protein